MSIITELKNNREAKGLSIEKLAIEAGLSHSTLYRIEANTAKGHETFEKLASALGCEWKLVKIKNNK